MRAVRALCLLPLLALLSAPVSADEPVKDKPAKKGKGDPPPIPFDKWSFDYAEKTFGLKAKGLSYEAKSKLYTLVFEFTKDQKAEELVAVRAAFPPAGGGIPVPVLAFYFFDEERVVLAKQQHFYSTSAITGVKGDAFRMTVDLPPKGMKPLTGVAKVELRQNKND